MDEWNVPFWLKISEGVTWGHVFLSFLVIWMETECGFLKGLLGSWLVLFGNDDDLSCVFCSLVCFV